MFVYSTSSNSIFSIHCAVFISQEKRKNLNTFVNVGCNDWHNIIERQSIHVERKLHKDAIKNAHNIINRLEKPEGTIYYHSDVVYHDRCNKYPKILEVIVKSFIFMEGKEKKTLQESDKNKNLENFLTYLKELQNYCPELKEYLEVPQSKSATYFKFYRPK